MSKHQEEDDDDTDHQSALYLSVCLVTRLQFTTPFGLDALRKFISENLRLQRFRLSDDIHAIDNIHHDGDGSHSIAVADLTILPDGFYRCHLTQRYRTQTTHDRNRLIGNVCGH